jgi:hypothetical protein
LGVGMLRLIKKRKSFIWSLVFLWGFYFFFSPFLHFHPNDVHTHDGELQSHQHKGHIQTFEHIQFSYFTNIPPIAQYDVSLFIQSDPLPLYLEDSFQERSPPVLYQFII